MNKSEEVDQTRAPEKILGAKGSSSKKFTWSQKLQLQKKKKSRKRGSGQPVFGLNLMLFKLFNIMKLLDLLECITWFNRIGQNMQNPKFGQNPLRID